MNIKPEFRTSKEWKKYKRALKHDGAMEFYVNICCELEGVTRATKQNEAYLDTQDPEDIAFMCGADDYDVDGEDLVKAFLESGLMVEEDNRFRFISSVVCSQKPLLVGICSPRCAIRSVLPQSGFCAGTLSISKNDWRIR